MPHQIRIATLEDDPAQIALIGHVLNQAGYFCVPFTASGKLLAALQGQEPFDLLLIDWEVPDISGLDVVRWVRVHHGNATPIIFVTSRTLESDLVTGLGAGADDYITKPFGHAELLARIGAQLRRRGLPSPIEADFGFGPYAIDIANREIRLNDEPVMLTPKEFDLAVLFLRNPWRLFSRDTLSMIIWNREVPATSRTLDSHLSSIRKKLQIGPKTGMVLVASYALGYRLELTNHSNFPPPGTAA